MVDDEENNGSVAEEVLLDDKGEDPLGEKGELGREAEHTVIVVEVTSTEGVKPVVQPPGGYLLITRSRSKNISKSSWMQESLRDRCNTRRPEPVVQVSFFDSITPSNKYSFLRELIQVNLKKK